MYWSPVLLVTVSLVLMTVGCDDPDPDAGSEPTTQSQTESSTWSYSGNTGPEHWAELSPEYAPCDGNVQSPVNLENAEAPDGATMLKSSYTTEKGDVEDTGHAIQVNMEGGTLTYEGTTYKLTQFHIHAPSEHTVEGDRFAAEIHLVHAAGEDQRAVVGIFVEEGDREHPALDRWIQGTDTTTTVNVGRLLPDRQSYYTYVGSLTTPPCSENVRWLVMDTPITASTDQLDAVRAQYEGNARPLQPLGDRRLTYVGP